MKLNTDTRLWMADKGIDIVSADLTPANQSSISLLAAAAYAKDIRIADDTSLADWCERQLKLFPLPSPSAVTVQD
jgi:hypothetical protein